jgi:hypothetical protein
MSSGNSFNISELFSWREYTWNHTGATKAATIKPLASDIINQPVLMSMTTTSFRIDSAYLVIEKMFATGYIWPDRLYLFLSSEPHLLDKGVHPDAVPNNLKDIVRRYPVTIVFTGQNAALRG